MSNLHHSEETHQQLLARLHQNTGTELSEWFTRLEDGPSLLRFDERVNWLRDEHDVAHGYATAIVHEHDKVRAAQRMQ